MREDRGKRESISITARGARSVSVSYLPSLRLLSLAKLSVSFKSSLLFLPLSAFFEKHKKKKFSSPKKEKKRKKTRNDALWKGKKKKKRKKETEASRYTHRIIDKCGRQIFLLVLWCRRRAPAGLNHGRHGLREVNYR